MAKKPKFRRGGTTVNAPSTADVLSGITAERRDTPEISVEPTLSKSASRQDMSFGQAFRNARNSGDNTFMWRGRSYGTQMAGERSAAPAARRSTPTPAPTATRPATTRTAAAPTTNRPAATRPAATRPAATRPAAATPAPTTTRTTATTRTAAANRPAATTTTRPAATRPAATRPAATRPAATRPAATRPAATRPAATVPNDSRRGRYTETPYDAASRGRSLANRLLRRGAQEEAERVRAARGAAAERRAGRQMAKGGSVSSRGDGIAKRGKTKGKIT
jgi:hypothetical protein